MATAVYTNAGQAYTVDQLDPATQDDTPGYFGNWGGSANAPAVSDTSLVVEFPEARVACTVTQSAADTLQFVFEQEADANRAVYEAGILTEASGGTLVLRGTHALINAEYDAGSGTGDLVRYTFKLRFKDVSEA